MAPSRVTLASAQNPDPVKIRIQFHQKKMPSDSNFRPVGNPVYAELWHSLKEIASGIFLDRSRTGVDYVSQDDVGLRRTRKI